MAAKKKTAKPSPEEETPKAEAPKQEAPAVDFEKEVKRLKNLVNIKDQEIARLKDQNHRLKEQSEGPKVPARYSDFVDETDAPKKNPNLGDLTPEYVEWARKNMRPDVFQKRYKGRLPEQVLNPPKPKAESKEDKAEDDEG